MSYLSERVNYIKGLADGMKLDDSDNSKLIKEIIAVLEDITIDLEDIQEQVDENTDAIDDIDDSIDCLDDEIFGDDDDGEYYDEECEEIECPNCGAMISVDPDLFDLEDGFSINCPECGEEVTVDFDCDGFCDTCPGCEYKEAEIKGVEDVVIEPTKPKKKEPKSKKTKK